MMALVAGTTAAIDADRVWALLLVRRYAVWWVTRSARLYADQVRAFLDLRAAYRDGNYRGLTASARAGLLDNGRRLQLPWRGAEA